MPNAVVTEDVQSRQMAALVHISPWLAVMMPGANLLAPLLFLVIRPDDDFVRNHVMSEMDMQIFWTLLTVLVTFGTCGLGVFAMLPLLVCFLIFQVMAAVEASAGRAYDYPLTPILLPRS